MIKFGLKNLAKVKGRVEAIALTDKIKLIDDSYNASVPAMKAAADLLSGFKGVRWLILGNMAELGDESLALHRQVGEHAAPFNFEHVLTYGADAKAISEQCQGTHFDTHESMIEFIEQQLIQHDEPQTLLVKGANSAGMSKIAAALKEMYS
jgi:UDP-N-acetylmuramoyl-tripeptide--D-alanyl-D-alanine ligase